jgi:hypothetical protein
MRFGCVRLEAGQVRDGFFVARVAAEKMARLLSLLAQTYASLKR